MARAKRRSSSVCLASSSWMPALSGSSARTFETSVARRKRELVTFLKKSISIPWMRVRQTIAYIAAFYSNWDDKLAEELVSKWELNPEEKVSSLSIGQVQKLALILALGHKPELLILDEPAASLDPAARRTFLSAVVEIAS